MSFLGGPSTRREQALIAVGLAALMGGLAVLAYQGIFSLLGPQDDEGYLIISLREFLAGGAPYAEVHSQYGPGLFTFVGAPLDVVGIPLTTDGARFVNLGLWLASSALAAVVLLRLTRSAPISVAGLLLTFLILSVDANEPLHPGALLGFLLLAIAAVAVFLLPTRPLAAMIAIGALAGVMISIKVNVGGLAVISVAAAWALHLRPWRRLVAVRLLLVGAFAAVPFLLLAGRFEDQSTWRYALAVGAGSLGVTAIAARGRGGEVPGPAGLLALGGGVVVALLVAALGPLVAGTDPAQLLEGWILDPAQMPDLAFAPLLLHPWTPVWAVAGLAAAALLAWRLGKDPLGPRARSLLGAFRIAIGLGIWLSLSQPFPGVPGELTRGLAVAAPFAWVGALPDREPRLARLLLCALAVLQALHAFPVAGSQIGWSEFLFVLVGGLCVADGIEDLAAGPAPGLATRGWRLAGAVAAAGFVVWFTLNPLRDYAGDATTRYEDGVSMGLPGAERTRLAADRVAQLQDLVGGLERRCESFLTLPGLNSLYLYAEEPPPAVLTGPWPWFFAAEDQRTVLAEARRLPGLCVVQKPDVLLFWEGFAGVPAPARPLVRFLRERFRPAHDYSGYILEVPGRGPPGRGS